MDLFQLASGVEVLVADIVEVDGLLFIKDKEQELTELHKKIASYESPIEAQSWVNIVLVDGFINEAVGDEWEDDDPSAQRILSAISSAWTYQILAKFPDAQFSIEKISDEEYGDFGLRLTGSAG
jgi:hypothetical protein